MLAAAASVAPDIEVKVWRDAHQLIEDLLDGLARAEVISLDHDLNPIDANAPDPGTGYDVAKLLGQLIPCCPIIIHTSNGERGSWMIGELSRAGWRIDRVYPFGDDWIAGQWAAALRRCLIDDT